MANGSPPARMDGSSPTQNHFRGFTLLEVILAIGLSTVVLLILTMAIHQFLTRTDAGQREVETSQLARALLNRMANDFRKARFAGFASGNQDSSSREQNEPPDENGELGIVGTATEIRIDQSASWRWEPVPMTEPADDYDSTTDTSQNAQSVHPPETVHYFLRPGETLSTAELAKMGVHEMAADSIAGLCLERWTTASSRTDSADSLTISESMTSPHSQFQLTQLLAPEVIELEFAYADSAGELFDQWNSIEQSALPRAIEIRLVLRKVPLAVTRGSQQAKRQAGRPDDPMRPSRSNTETYRLVVSLPDVQPPRSPTTDSPRNSMSSTRSNDSSDSANSSNTSDSADTEGGSSSSPGSDR